MLKGFPHTLHFRESLHWTASLCPELPASTVFLPSEPALIKGAPGILFQTIWLSLSPSNWSYAAISPSTSSLANQSGFILTYQDSAFWTNQTARTWSPQLHKVEPIRDQVRDFCLYKSVRSGSESTWSLSTKDCALQAGAETQRMSLQSRVHQCRPE